MPIMQEDEIDELKAGLAKARKKETPFGLCMGKKPEDCVMYLDRLKSPEVVKRRAKKAGETNKLCCGMVFVKGKKLLLTLEDDAVPGMAKNLRKFFSGISMKMKIVVLDASGQELESDGDEDDDAQVADQNQDNNDIDPDDPAAAQWLKVSGAMTPLIETFVASGDPKAAAVQQAWTGAQTAASNGDYKSALGVAAKLRPIVSGNSSSNDVSSDDPNAEKWAKLQGPLEALYEKAMKNNPPNRSKLSGAWGMAIEKAEAGDFKGAIAIAGRIKPLLDEAASATSSGQEGEIAKDVVAFQKSRVLWVNTRTKMFSEMKKLEDAIVSTCGNDPELADVVTSVSALTEQLNGFDESLQDVLDEITNTPEGDERTKLKQKAQGAVKDYKALLEQPFFKDVDSNNGFVNVSVTALASKSLASIEKVLAA